MTIRPTTDRNNRMEAIVTETQDEDLNKPATIGTLRMLAVHADAGFAQIHLGLERLSDKIDSVEKNLNQRIEHVDDNLDQKIESLGDNLDQRIDTLEAKLTERIDSVESKLTERINAVESKLTERINAVESKLTERINGVESKLTERINGVESKLTQKVDHSVIELKAEMAVNMSTILDQLVLRSNSERFIKAAFAVAVLGILIQTVIVAWR